VQSQILYSIHTFYISVYIFLSDLYWPHFRTVREHLVVHCKAAHGGRTAKVGLRQLCQDPISMPRERDPATPLHFLLEARLAIDPTCSSWKTGYQRTLRRWKPFQCR